MITLPSTLIWSFVSLERSYAAADRWEESNGVGEAPGIRKVPHSQQGPSLIPYSGSHSAQVSTRTHTPLAGPQVLVGVAAAAAASGVGSEGVLARGHPQILHSCFHS